MATQFQVGEHVRILIDNLNPFLVPFGISREMRKYQNKIAKIVDIKEDFYYPSTYPAFNCDGAYYILDIDNKSWRWANIFFGKLVPNSKNKIKKEKHPIFSVKRHRIIRLNFKN